MIKSVNNLFSDHPELVSDFGMFLPSPLKVKMEKELKKRTSKRKARVQEKNANDSTSDTDQARAFVQKIKHKFSDQPHIYKSFLEDLYKFSGGQLTLSDVYDSMYERFKDYPDLLEDLSNFLPDLSPNSSQKSEKPQTIQRPKSKRAKVEDKDEEIVEEGSFKLSKGSYGTYEELQFFFKIRQTLKEEEYSLFLKFLMLFNESAITNTDLYYLVRSILEDADPVLLNWFKKFIGVTIDDEPSGYLADFDWSKEVRLGPSYRSTPMKWRQWKCSGRIGNKICAEVLNDAWISVPTGSEDGTFKNSRKNQYEEILFKCEDDRYELDMIIEQNLSAIKFLEDLLIQLSEMSQEELSQFKISIPVITGVALKRVYEDKSLEIINLLQLKPFSAIPIVIKRLNEKNLEWTLSRKEWSKLWNRIIKENYYKSLDHQSINFKQEEKKCLQHKFLVSELKKNKQKFQTDDKIVTEPILIFNMKSNGILKDIKALLMLAFDLVLRKGYTEKFEEFFEAFIEEFLMMDDKSKIDNSMNNQNEEDVNCKPITTTLDKEEDSQPRTLFIGNASYYIMFRYIVILYNRLIEGWRLSALESPKTYVNELFLEGDEEEEKDVKKDTEEGDYQTKRYGQFLYNVELLLSNAIDQSMFEDKCRSIFGLSSYVLFTIDRIVILLAKQIQTILSEESSKQLRKLYQLSRKHNFNEYLYINHCRDILSNEKFPCIFTYDKTYLGIIDIEELSTPSSEIDRIHSEYINNLANESETILMKYSSNPPLFLKRNIKEQIDDIEAEISNQLECKVIPNSHRLGYVENTEDYFYRKKRK